MPRLYKKISKRLAKKRIGNRWNILQAYANGEIDVGSIITTCRGYNEIISDLIPVISDYKLKNGWYVIDADIETENGGCCSLTHCCTYPTKTKSEILAYFKYFVDFEENIEWNFGTQHNRIVEAIKNNEDPFNDNGCIKEDYIMDKGDNQ